MRVPLSSITLSDLERRYVVEALDGAALSSSAPQVAAFEAAMAKRIGRAHAIATNSGTSALELSLWAMNVGPGDEVLVPALTFAAPALAVCRVGATPVFVDIDEATWTIDPVAAAEARTARTRAIVAVDVLGHPCDHDSLERLGVPILEDAAEAFGARCRGRQVGAFGVAAVFSFHANKAVSSGEGGCIVTDDAELAARIRQINAFGMDPDRRYWHSMLGCNQRMAGLVASVALAQLERADELLAGRRQVAARYDAGLRGCRAERRPVAQWADEAVWLYTVAVGDPAGLVETCRRHGVDARRIWPALPDNPALRQFERSPCPRARALAARAVWLPTWADMPEEAIETVIAAVRAALHGGTA